MASIHPSVTQVVYDDECRWSYSDSSGAAVAFAGVEDLDLLEEAANESYCNGLQNIVFHLDGSSLQPSASSTENRGRT